MADICLQYIGILRFGAALLNGTVLLKNATGSEKIGPIVLLKLFCKAIKIQKVIKVNKKLLKVKTKPKI